MESQTLSSSPDEGGERYWASFSSSCFAKGSTCHVHKGILNGMGPRSGEKAIVKAFRDEAGTEERCDREILKADTAEELAALFNRSLPAERQTIRFAKPMKALMDRVALMNGLTLSRRKLSGQEWVLIEQNMGRYFQRFVGRWGDTAETVHPHLTAFVHFSFFHSRGEMVACGLKGREDEHGWTLKIPTIHSLKESFGASDCGQSGIAQVFSKHKCNYICEHMQLPNNEQGINAMPFNSHQSSPMPCLNRQASAPYDPEVFCNPSSPMVQAYVYLPPQPPYIDGHSQEMCKRQSVFYIPLESLECCDKSPLPDC